MRKNETSPEEERNKTKDFFHRRYVQHENSLSCNVLKHTKLFFSPLRRLHEHKSASLSLSFSLPPLSIYLSFAAHWIRLVFVVFILCFFVQRPRSPFPLSISSRNTNKRLVTPRSNLFLPLINALPVTRHYSAATKNGHARPYSLLAITKYLI